MSKYRINVLTVKNVTLTFTISEYRITKGEFIEFVDEKTNIPKKFHASRCEIEEVLA